MYTTRRLFEDDGHYKFNFKSVQRQIVFHLDQVGRREPNPVLDWRRTIENSTVMDLRKEKLYLAPLFLEAAHAFLSIQASSAFAERLFGDAGFRERARRQTGDPSVTEMLLLIRSYVHSRLDSAHRQRGFIRRRAQAFKEIARTFRVRFKPLRSEAQMITLTIDCWRLLIDYSQI